MTWKQRIAQWLDPTPERINREQMELIVKAGRRCAHDLDHCADDVFMTRDRIGAMKEWKERANLWRRIFYPEDGPKDYRTRLHTTISMLEGKLGRLREILADHGIEDPTDEGDIPF